MNLAYMRSASIACETHASRLEGGKREQRAKASRHIIKARVYPFPPFFARVHLGDNGEQDERKKDT